MKMKLPKLYGKSSTGKIKVWKIEALENCFQITYGYENGKMQVQSRPVEPKNIGKSNETTQKEQAILETKARWQKQIDKGYREHKEDIGDGPYIIPMKSDYYNKKFHKIVWPAILQPKLNGIKTIVPERKGGFIYQSNGGKYYDAIHHLDKEIKNIPNNIVLDGEIYKHGIDLQDISSATKKKNKLSQELEYWVYDIVSEDNYEKRLEDIQEYIKTDGKIKVCPSHIVNSHEEVVEWFKYYVNLDYEGVMIKNKNGKYKFGPTRSVDSLKYKDFKDEEFKIVDYECDTHGRVIWWCVTNGEKRFKAVPKGTHANRKKWYKNGDSFIGKMLTVKFLEYSKDKCPQGNVVGICVRDYE